MNVIVNHPKFFLIRKSYVILLELLIAMGLTIIILSTLIYFYNQVSLMNIEMDREQNDSFRKLYVENRLAHIFPRTIASNDPSSDFHFFTSYDSGGLFMQGTPSLLFTFDNGVQQDKTMSYHVIARLFLDSAGNLVLAKWPAEKRWKENGNPPISKEVLLDNVEKLSFGFFIPPDKQKNRSDQDKKGKSTFEISHDLKGKWVGDWPKEYHQLPAIVRLSIVSKDRKGEREILYFLFPLPHTTHPITYED